MFSGEGSGKTETVQGKSIFSGFFSKGDKAGPPPKEVKLGLSGKQRYDKEKKRWVFEGEENEDGEVFVPPPKAFAKKDLQGGGKRKLYVDVMGEKDNDKPYEPAGVEDKELFQSPVKPKPEPMKIQELKIDLSPKENCHELSPTNLSPLLELQPTLKDFPENVNQTVPDLSNLSFLISSNEVLQILKSSQWPLTPLYTQDDLIKALESEHIKQKLSKAQLKVCELKENAIFAQLKYSKKSEQQSRIIKDLTTQLEQEASKLQMTQEDLSITSSKLQKKTMKLNTFHNQLQQSALTITQLQEKMINLSENNENLKLLIEDSQKNSVHLNEKIKTLEEYNGQMLKKNKILENEKKNLTQKNSSLIQQNEEFSEKLEKNRVLASVLQKHFFEYLRKISELEIENKGLEERIKYLSVPEWQETAQGSRDNEERWKKVERKMAQVAQDRSELQGFVENLLKDYQSSRESFYLDLEHEKLKLDGNLNRVLNELNSEKQLTEQLKHQIFLFKQELTEKDSVIKQIHHNFTEDLEKMKEVRNNSKAKIKELTDLLKTQKKKIDEKNELISNLENIIQDLQNTSKNTEKIDNAEAKYEKLKRKYAEITENLKKVTEHNEALKLLLDATIQKTVENELEINKLKESVSILNTQNEDFESELNEKNLLIDSLQAEKLNTLLRLSELDLLVTEKNNENLEYLQRIDELDKTLKELAMNSDQTNEKLLQIRQSLQDELNEKVGKIEELELQNSEKSEKIEELVLENSQKNRIILEIEAECKKLEENFLCEREKSEKLNQKILEQDDEKQNFDLASNELRIHLEEKEKEKLKILAELQELNEKYSNLQSDHSEIAEKNSQLSKITQENEKYYDILMKQDLEIGELQQKLNSQSELYIQAKSDNEKLEQTLESLKNQIKSSESSVDPVQIKKLKESEQSLKQEVENLTEDIENMYSKNLQLSQKLSNFTAIDLKLKEKLAETENLQQLLIEKNEELSKLTQRLREKDEELLLSKAVYQQIMSSRPEGIGIIQESPEKSEKSENFEDLSQNSEENRTVEQTGWLASILSAVFLTDSERGSK